MLLEAYYEDNKDKLTSVLARYSGDYDASADAVQEAFIRALKNRALLCAMPEKSLWSWLYTAAKNALTDEKRKTSRLEQFEDRGEAGPESDPTDAILAKEMLYKLPPNLMNVVALRYYGGLNATEIGEMKGIPAATVRSQLRAALAILKKHAGFP